MVGALALDTSGSERACGAAGSNATVPIPVGAGGRGSAGGAPAQVLRLTSTLPSGAAERRDCARAFHPGLDGALDLYIS